MYRGVGEGRAGLMPIHKRGSSAWLALVAGVLAWDALAPETMSAAFRSARSTPARRIMVDMAWVTLTAHLYDVLPERADPLVLAVKALRYRRLARECSAI